MEDSTLGTTLQLLKKERLQRNLGTKKLNSTLITLTNHCLTLLEVVDLKM